MELLNDTHWTTELPEFDPNDWFGFCYRLTHIETSVQYIGKKQFFSTTRKKIKGRKNRKKVVKESDWKKYTSSSKYVNEMIEEHGIEIFKFEIISLHSTKASLYYEEVRLQVVEDVLRAKMPNGEKKYLNKQIGSVKFIPPEETLLEAQFKVL